MKLFTLSSVACSATSQENTFYYGSNNKSWYLHTKDVKTIYLFILEHKGILNRQKKDELHRSFKN